MALGRVWLFASVFVLAGCAAGARQIVETRDLSEAGRAPSIDAIVDLGGGDVPREGELRVRPTDGVAVIGEVLWIRGGSFGRQPTVLIGGRPAAVLSRTGDGGILVRVPPGTPAGEQPVIVSNEHGQNQHRIPIRRYAVLVPPAGGRVAFAEMGPEGPAPSSSIELSGARFLRISPEGRAAYVISDKGGVLTVIELPAAGGPAVFGKLDVAVARVRALAVAAAAPVAVLVRDEEVLILDIAAPLRPARLGLLPLPPVVAGAGVRRADVSPDGKLLAIAVVARNQVFLLDRARTGRDAVVASLALAPEVRAGVLVDLAFSPDGGTLWVLSGATDESRPMGPQPTRVFALRLVRTGGGIKLDAARTVTLDAAADPARISTGRSLPLVSGAGIRLPPERATVFISATLKETDRSAVFALGAEDLATELLGVDGGLAVGGVDVSPEGRWLLGAVAGKDGGFRVHAAPADSRPGAPRSVLLLPGAGSGPAAAAEVRVQP